MRRGFSPRALGLSGGPAVDWRRSGVSSWSDAKDQRLLAVIPSDPWYVRGLVPTLSSRAYAATKRVVDIVVSLLSLPVVIPILVLCAIAIRIDSPGKPFFSQLRTGRGGHRFKMFKMRTMVHNAAELKAKYAHLNELAWPDFKITDDPRCTRVGRFLRKTSLDELPQIFNVLLGDMSLVGPRPTSFAADTYSLWHTARLEVKPGLTGLWQISGRYQLQFDERLRLDIAYIRHRCLALDLYILFRTVGAVFSGRGAS